MWGGGGAGSCQCHGGAGGASDHGCLGHGVHTAAPSPRGSIPTEVCGS